jgi:3-deoxy-manno-octulosonate cytidylyltransferase (CMP-KDO synthetase)
MGTLAQRVSPEEGMLQSGSDVFLTCDIHGKALYFSRSIIPFQRDTDEANWVKNHHYLRHVGMYAFRPKALRRFAQLSESPLEKAEKLEQLRWLENGHDLYVAVTEYKGISVDTAEDLERIRKLI